MQQSFTSNATPPNTTQPPRQKQTLLRLIVSAILLLTLLLIASGATLLYHAGIIRPMQHHMQAIATMQSVATSKAQTRIQATTAAHATVQRQAKATSIAQATAQVTATATALQDIYTQSTAGHPDLASPLTFETGSHWDIYPTKDNGGCAFTDYSLHSSVNTPDYFVPCLAHATHYKNLAFEIQMTIIKGDEGGIIFRSDDKGQKFYSYRIQNNGTYKLMLTKNNSRTRSLVFDKSNLIKTGNGQTNTLTVIARDTIIYLYINKHYVGCASDGALVSGSIGVIAVNRKHPTNIAFNNLRIWKLN
jgi:hypothetical protein